MKRNYLTLARRPAVAPHGWGISFPILLAVALCLGRYQPARGETTRPDPQRFESAIRAWEPPHDLGAAGSGPILFLGSSSIRMWDLPKAFPDLPTINRGFGGSLYQDLRYYADRIILPVRPRTIVLYAGDNDIAAGLAPQQVCRDFCSLVSWIHCQLPETRVVVIAIKPSPSRWKYFPKTQEANRLLRCVADQNEFLEMVDVVPPMLGPDGLPRPELYLDDQLHLNKDGYALWTQLVRPYLQNP